MILPSSSISMPFAFFPIVLFSEIYETRLNRKGAKAANKIKKTKRLPGLNKKSF